MIFQVLDDKTECLGFYCNQEITFNMPSDLTSTWSYNPALKDLSITYAYLYCAGKTMRDVCPENLKNDYEDALRRLRAFKLANKLAKINVNEFCIFDVMPEFFLKHLFELKNRITAHVLETQERPNDYEFLEKLHKIAVHISCQKLNMDLQNTETIEQNDRIKSVLRSLQNVPPYICFDIFGTKVGGLKTKKGSFPILSLDRPVRSVLIPNNDVFIELDYNAAHLRVMLGLCGEQQPSNDIHEWNKENFFPEIEDRDEIKRTTFAWLYGDVINPTLEKVYNKKKILETYFFGDKIKNIYGREIWCDKHVALNYIIASTANDLFLRKVVEIADYLKDKKSYIAAIIQDSVLLDFDKGEKDLITDLTKIFSHTKIGDFKTNVRIGKDFGNMRKINV